MTDDPSLEQYRITKLEERQDRFETRMEGRVSILEATTARVASIFDGQQADAKELSKAIKLALVGVLCSFVAGAALLVAQHFLLGGHS